METKIIISIEELDMLIRKVISEELVKFEESKECKYITRTEAAKILKITLMLKLINPFLPTISIR